MMDNSSLKKLIASQDPSFWRALDERTAAASSFSEFLALAVLRRQAEKQKLADDRERKPLRLAMIGSFEMYPLRELIVHQLYVEGFACELFVGEFDNWVSEIVEDSSRLHEFRPEAVLVLPPARLARSQLPLAASRAEHEACGREAAQHILGLCRQLHEKTGTEVIVSNFIPGATFDLGPYGSRTLGSERNFSSFVNMELGLGVSTGIHVCDTAFLACRLGTLASIEERGWFESKQFCSPRLMIELAREVAHLVGAMRRPAKKVLVLDLDNTLWGGVIGDDGLNGIEIGDTSPRGEAFKAFQKYIASLTTRGLLLAVCSKNDLARAREPFESHPEMVLRVSDFVSFKANWEPKSENLRAIAAELNLGLDSFVFVDDNPAEIEIVRRFTPEVSTILLGTDPSTYVRELQDSRHFEIQSLTAEDQGRTEQYRQEAGRKALLASATDMGAYLESLEMVGTFAEFVEVDVPRISQLINKSNQFNLTTRRRSEAEVTAVMKDRGYRGFTFRLSDKFGDHGLVSVVICRIDGTKPEPAFEIDTWLMSCRVLKRQVEEAVANEIERLAREAGCSRVIGRYVPTEKNEMVRGLYPRLGFRLKTESGGAAEYEYDPRSAPVRPTKIAIKR